MERIDLVIVVLAVVAVGGSVAGLLTYEGGGLKTYVMQFEAHELDGQEDDATIQGSGSEEFTFTVDQANLTQVEVEATVSTSDARLSDRDVQLEVESPEGETRTKEATISSGAGSVEVTLSSAWGISDVPPDHEEQATSADAVRRQAIRDHRHTNGTGEWVATVTISGGDVQDPASFDVIVSLAGSYFDVHVSQKTPDVQR